ncbi:MULTISPECIES: F0F1 ATP synthase subunit A [unclassified Erysipelothrix]|uniref:F0F1 ATP synthase subunit A n=1 Tax=unclassified Erysipelothrix TaxID=2624170 RepID=UPI001909DFF6|nr:F0F1 ATP synthase subunit A [Erysipelothrix sp. strain 2 (EsS2-6-Brazil)]MBK2402656.1 F0F1 ATP synthase subunit A [Erysipelothrix sp. strain 2 (EsS2-6-Brazil)]
MVQSELYSVLILTIAVSALIYVIGTKLKDLTLEERPKGLVLKAVLYVQTITTFTVQNMGEKHGKRMAAYIGSVFIYILLANMMGLTGLEAPTSNYSVTLVLAIITFVLIQIAKIDANGVKGYIKGFFEPFFPFVIPNFFGTVAPLISLSLRLFGNVLSGTVIMTLLYTFTAWVSSFVPVIGGFNFMGVIVAPVLHLYFDLFSAFLQAFIFISLTSILIAVEYSE